MSHLSNDDLLNAVEGGTGHSAHLATCEACRARVESLRSVLALTSRVDVPEPSPLFWDHFSSRVRDAVAAEPQPHARFWRLNFAWTASVVGVLAIAIIGAAVTLRTARPVENAATTSVASTDAGVTPAVNVPSLGEDETWALMGELASQMDWEDAREAGLTARPGSAEQAVEQMSQEEQRQLVELLEMELQKSKSL